jgi:hypothetical protein
MTSTPRPISTARSMERWSGGCVSQPRRGDHGRRAPQRADCDRWAARMAQHGITDAEARPLRRVGGRRPLFPAGRRTGRFAACGLRRSRVLLATRLVGDLLRPEKKRLKGFEPSTFCMASRCPGSSKRPNSLHFRGSASCRPASAFHELRPIAVGLDTEWTPKRRRWALSGRADRRRTSCPGQAPGADSLAEGVGCQIGTPGPRQRSGLAIDQIEPLR